MPKFKENIPLSKFSHYKIGGPARFFFEAKNEKEVVWAIAEAKKRKLSVFILAGGTNLLLCDKGFDGLVLRPAITTLKAKKDGALEVGAGVLMSELLNFAVARSLSGLEWAGGLPGTIGGAIRGNAGCFGGETKDNIVSIRSFNTKTMKFVERSAKVCAFKYRDSVFKKKHGAEIIISATLKLAKGDKKAIARAIKEKIEYRKKNHPLEYPNIGSTFKNVPLHDIHKKGGPAYKKAIAARELVFRGSHFSVKTDPFPVISAAKLISESGLRGVSAGGAMISPKHPNFIVNVLNASSCNAKSLIVLAKAEVYKKFGVQLQEEIQVI
jgi:UDP-N-acetylmuramate dehydrogenase